MRELVYYVAATLDGFIARPNGAFDEFPWDPEFIEALERSFPETLPAPMRPGASRRDNRRFDAVIMGRATYDVGAAQGLTSPYPTLDQFVVSTTLGESPDAAVELIDSDVSERVRALKAQPGKAVWLCGGGTLATSLLAAGLVDRLILKSAPVLFGEGIPLFRDRVAGLTLHREAHQTFQSGYTISEFRVES